MQQVSESLLLLGHLLSTYMIDSALMRHKYDESLLAIVFRGNNAFQIISPTHAICVSQEESVKLQSALDLHSLPEVPSYCRQQPCYEAAKRIAVYAHKLSYTTFAPETVLGQNLFRPPAPQEWDFRASALHAPAGMLFALKLKEQTWAGSSIIDCRFLDALQTRKRYWEH